MNCTITILRLERAISRLGAPHGYDGDPLAERIPCGKTLSDLHAAHKLRASLPVELRSHPQALRMAQAAVFGRTREPALSTQAMPTPTVDAKLERERRRASA